MKYAASQIRKIKQNCALHAALLHDGITRRLALLNQDMMDQWRWQTV